MLSVSSLLPVAAIDQLLDPKVIESLKIFGVHPAVYMPLAAMLLSIAAGYGLAKLLRLKDYGWKFSLILAAWTMSIAIIAFGTFKLGADLRGGVNLVYEVDEEATAVLNPKGGLAYDLAGAIDVLRQRINPSGVKDLVIRKAGPKQIEVVVSEVDKAQIDDIKRRFTSTGSLQFMIVANDPTKDGHIIDAAKALEKNEKTRQQAIVTDDAGKTIGIWTEVAREDAKADSPFRHSPVYRDVIRNRATGELITLTPSEEAEIARGFELKDDKVFTRLLAQRGIREIEVLLRAPDNEDVDVKGEDLAYASPSLTMEGWEIDFRMKPQGIGKMGALTGSNLAPPERNLAIVFDGKLISAPTIQSQITERGRITGQFSEAEVRFMAELLKSGSMPVVMHETPIAENMIGSILGRDTIIKGSWSLAISLLVVLVLVTLYYRLAGFTAALALVLNLLLTVAIMIVIQAPFTLPGLAGLVLTVGMSIDANVLIFERIREETARGAALRMALRNGFDKALSAIIDGNLTTFFTALVLYVFGTDQLRGFGITLMLGNVISMFTAIFCARVIFDAGERTRWLTSLSMTQFLTNPQVDWVKLFMPTTIGSCTLILIGLVAAISRGAGIFDIDLKGGSSVTPMLRESMTDAEVRSAMKQEFANLKDEKTGGSVDFQVFEVSIQNEAPGTAYKIDSSLEKVADLQNHVQHALKDPNSSADRVRTYQMDFQILSSTPANVAPGAESPASPDNPADPAAPAKAGDSAGAAQEKEKASDKAAPAKDAANCGQPDEAAKTDDAKAVEKSEPETKTQPAAKAVPTESKASPAADDAKPAAKAESKPATADAQPPSGLPSAPAGLATEPPRAPTSGQKTIAEIRFPNNEISAYALQEHIKQAAGKSINQNPFVTVSNPQWDGRDNSTFETWKVEMDLSEENARKVLTQLETTMEASPVWQNTASVSGQVTLDMQLKALGAVLGSLLGIAAYIWFRFQKLSWGIAAIASLAHDTLVMIAGIGVSYYVASALGFLGIDEFKISLTVVAGFLTLIGYSINDTIVIFDRIREMRGKSTLISAQMINDAVNQTLSRTILTGGLTFLVVIILYIWGGEGIHTFAFCMLIGVISGTYSTVFIAAPLLLWLMKSAPASTPAAKTTAIKQPVSTAGGRT